MGRNMNRKTKPKHRWTGQRTGRHLHRLTDVGIGGQTGRQTDKRAPAQFSRLTGGQKKKHAFEKQTSESDRTPAKTS